MGESSRLELVIDSKGVVTANGNLDLFKKKSDEAAKAATSLETSNKKTGQSFDVLSDLTSIQTIAMGAANLGIIKFMDSCAKTAGTMEMLQTNLRVVTGSAKEADVIFRQLQSFAAETPFGVEGITDTAIQLLNVNVAAGDLMDTLRMLGDVSGGSQEKLNRIMMNYTQILSVGKASTMDVKQFAQANLPIYAELERVTGKTGEALNDMITNGEITGDVITEAFRKMTEEGGKFFNGMALAADTWQGKKSTMEDSIKGLTTSFTNLWLLGFQKNAFDAITAVSDRAAGFLNGVQFGKNAFDTFNDDYSNSTFDQREYVANKQMEMYRERAQMLKRIGPDYVDDPEYKEAWDKYFEWDQYLTNITKSEAELTRAEREQIAALEAEAAALAAATEKAKPWQEILKKTLSLEEVTTGTKAVEEYQKSLEDSLEGAIVYAQLTGGNIAKVYLDYADQVDKAIKALLVSGQFAVDDNAIQGLLRLKKELSGESSDRTGFSSYQFGPAPSPQFMLNDEKAKGSFALAPFGGATGFTMDVERDIGIPDEAVDEQAERAKRLQDIYKQLGDDLKKFAADATFEALWDMGEALYAGEDAAKAFGKSLLTSILNNVPAMLFQTGFQLAISGNVYGGLALMAVSGLAGVAGGYLTSMMNDNGSQQSEADKLQNIADQLSDLITEARSEALYYQNTLRSINASSNNDLISNTRVNDAIIAPGGKIITTAPDDYLYAAKDPRKFGGSGMSLNVSIVNNVSDVATASVSTKENADGTKELLILLTKKVASDISGGAYDNALAARDARLRGRRISS